MLEITQKARDMLGQFAEQAENGGNLSLKVEIVGRGPKGFQYDLQLIGSEDAQDDDIEVEVDGVDVQRYTAPDFEKGTTH